MSSKRIAQVDQLPVENPWLSKAALEAAFIFAPSYFEGTENIEINRLGSHLVYRLHHEAWSKQDGVFFAETKN